MIPGYTGEEKLPMEKTLAFIILVLFASVAHAEPPEVRFLLSSMTPLSDDENWDNAYGLDVELINWFSPAVGVAAVAGVSQWNAKEYELYDYYPDSGTSVTARLDGDARVVPIGMSLLLRPVMNHAIEVTAEAGARYAIVNSNVTARYAVSDGFGTVYRKDRIEIDDGAYGLIALDIAFPLSPYARISVGFGYQFDLAKGDANYSGNDIGDSEFEASIARFGFNARF
jgi:hypothetical protein